MQQTTDWFNHRLPDGGPVYMETDMDRFIVEPWNAVSSLLIVLPAVYWLFRIGRGYRDHWFMILAIPLMVIGGTGSTLFHAFRISRFFLFMDFVPSAILTLMLTVYFWIKILKRWWYIFFIVFLSIGIRVALFSVFRPASFAAINISYTVTGVVIGLPVIVLLKKDDFYRWKEALLTIVFFITAILFREMDSRQITFLPMGTHFLWHAFTGFGGFFLLAYLFHRRKMELEKRTDVAGISPSGQSLPAQ